MRTNSLASGRLAASCAQARAMRLPKANRGFSKPVLPRAERRSDTYYPTGRSPVRSAHSPLAGHGQLGELQRRPSR
jgi:hypothetical protein